MKMEKRRKQLDFKSFKNALKSLGIKLQENVNEDSRVFIDAGIDSLEIIEIIIFFENEYGVHLSEEDMNLESDLTISELLDIFNSKILEEQNVIDL